MECKSRPGINISYRKGFDLLDSSFGFISSLLFDVLQYTECNIFHIPGRKADVKYWGLPDNIRRRCFSTLLAWNIFGIIKVFKFEYSCQNGGRYKYWVTTFTEAAGQMNMWTFIQIVAKQNNIIIVCSYFLVYKKIIHLPIHVK